MSRRRVLVLSYFYPPHGGGGVHRVLGFTRHLPEYGWDCTVVCGGAEDFWIVDDRLLERVPPGTRVVRVPGGTPLGAWLRVRRQARGTRPRQEFGWLRRLADFWLVPDPYVPWAARGRAAAARLLAGGGFDALLSTSPPDSLHLAAAALRGRFRVPWVADFRDPWMGLYHRRPPSAWHARRQAALERRVLAGADLVITASRTHAGMLQSRPDPPRRVRHLPNGFEPDPAAPAAESHPDPGVFRIVFTGTLTKMPDTEVVLEALHELLARRPEARRRIRVTLAGPFDTGYRDRAVSLGLTPGIVAFPGPLPHAESRALQRDADVLVMWKMERMEATVPGKLYEYLDSGRPVVGLLAAGDEAAELLERAGGIRVDPGDRAELALVLDRMYAAWQERGRTAAARPAWLAAHTRANLARELAGELDTLVAPGEPPR